MLWQVSGEVVSVELDVDEVHGERELVPVEHAILVDVRQLPDLSERRVGQARLDHLLLGCGTRDLAVDRVETLEDLVVLEAILADHPLHLTATLVDALASSEPKRTLDRTLEHTALDLVGGGVRDFLVRHHIHETRDVLGQHAVDGVDELWLETVELGEVVVHELLLKKSKYKSRQ